MVHRMFKEARPHALAAEAALVIVPDTRTPSPVVSNQMEFQPEVESRLSRLDSELRGKCMGMFSVLNAFTLAGARLAIENPCFASALKPSELEQVKDVYKETWVANAIADVAAEDWLKMWDGDYIEKELKTKTREMLMAEIRLRCDPRRFWPDKWKIQQSGRDFLRLYPPVVLRR